MPLPSKFELPATLLEIEVPNDPILLLVLLASLLPAAKLFDLFPFPPPKNLAAADLTPPPMPKLDDDDVCTGLSLR